MINSELVVNFKESLENPSQKSLIEAYLAEPNVESLKKEILSQIEEAIK